jgi:hypothetical protein
MYNELGIYFGFGILFFITTYYDAKYRAFKQYPILWATLTLLLPPLVILYNLNRIPKQKQKNP